MTALARIGAALIGAAVALAALPAMAEIEIQEVETPAGYKAWLSQDDGLPFVSLEIWFRGGTSVDLPDARGAVNLMTGLLEEGAGDLDAEGFANARDDLAASIEFDVGPDSLSVSGRFLSDTKGEFSDLLHLALTQPTFDETAVERVRGQVLAGLRADAEDPDEIAGTTFAAQIYGNHPYGSSGNGTIDSVTGLSRDDLLSAFKGAIASDRVYIAAAGDIGADELAALIDRILDGIPETGRPLPEPADPQFSGDVTLVPFATPQSVIQFAQPGLPLEDPDFFAAYALNQILGGGGFESRLMTEVREKRGLTYGVYSYLASRDLADIYVGGASTANARAAETIDVIRAEWQRMAEEGPTAEELSLAKTYLTGAYPLRFDGNGSIANILVGMQMQGYGTDYIETRNARVEAVTLDQVKRVAAELLDPAKLTFVVVGQPEGLDAAN